LGWHLLNGEEFQPTFLPAVEKTAVRPHNSGCFQTFQLPLTAIQERVSMRIDLRVLLVGLVLQILASAPAVFAQAGAAQAPAQPAAASASDSARSAAEEIGSLRNAKVAYPMPADKVQLTFFAGPMSEAEQAELKSVAPNVRIVAGLSNQEALARAGEAHGIDSRFATPEFIAQAKNLVWVQAMSAGVERYVAIEPLVKNDKIVLTNFRGVHGPTIADHAMGMLLMLTRDLQQYVSGGGGRRGGRGFAGPVAGGRGGAGRRGAAQPIALEGKTMLVVGIGGIGTEIAQRAHGFGMRVIGTRRSMTPGPAFVEKVGQSEDLLKMLPEADVVAIAVPLTAETENLFNTEAFAAMKQGSYLINIARGKIVNTAALVQAVESGKLAGACLDVTEPEPLPQDHPLRSYPNVIITPHVAGISAVTNERGAVLLKENIRRFGAGEPLMNTVDKQVGY
jgi:phosphoglycerate dehydrogenase-like enzyme